MIMKKYLLLLFVLVTLIMNSRADGWRPGEKQILITVNSIEEANLITNLKINYDVIAENQIRAYVIPKEVALLENSGISYQVEIEDLKSYSQSMQQVDASWHTYQDIIDLADSLAQEFPAICAKYIFGTSLGGRQLAALKISDNVAEDEPEAEVMFDGGIHGDEYPGSENVIRFARDICIGYGTDPDITYLVDNREIWLYLMVNPDGRVNVSRYNNNGVDLNRDWPYMWDGWGGSTGPCSQVESKALRECMYNNQFVVHTTYHAGTEYISLPWSYRSSQPNDWNHIYQLAGVYSGSSLYPNMTYGQGNTGMYAINGSTKDSNYGIQGCISWSMEISYDKMPPTSQIMLYYNRNYPAMMAMIEYAGYGLEGIVTDALSGDPVQATVFINNYYPTFTDPTAGDYHKYVLPGTYSITVVANGYETMTIDGIVVTENNATSTDFELQPGGGHYVYKFSSSQIPDNNEADEGFTPAVIGAPDNVYYSIGKYGWCVLDMQFPVIDGPGYDIIVYEGDATPEIYTCYIGETLDGPWISLGAGNGTTEFDIANSGLPEAQFIKILDDGDGSANVPDAGFDLDAIEALPPVSGVYLAMYDYVIDDSNGNNNGKIDPGETVDIIVTLKNNGDLTAENIFGEINTASAFLIIDTDTANFGTLAQSQTGEGTFTVTAQANTPAGEPAEIGLDVTSNGGTYNNSFSMNFVIGQIPVVIIDLDENHNSASEIKTAIETNGLSVESLTSFPAAVDVYSTIFVCLGIYSDNHVLTSGEGQMLADFLNGGGNLYMEGGDTWYYDDQTAVHSMFNINAESDGSSDLSTIAGQAGTFTEGMSFGYSGDNSWIDHISPVSPAMLILENQSPVYGTGVAYDEGSYKTIGCSHEFGGLTDGSSPSTKEELMAAYLEFFGIAATLQAAFTSSVTEICEQETIDFTDQSIGDIITWEWEFEGGTPATSSFQNPTVAYFNEGVYDVTLTVSDGTDSNTLLLEDYITVNAAPNAPEKPEGPEVVGSYPGWTNDYSVGEVPNAGSYIWQLDPPDAGTITENGYECTIDWTDYWEGDVNLSVKAVNDCGESDLSESLQILITLTDVNENSFDDINVFPNPNLGEFVLSFGTTRFESVDIKVLDNIGKVVFESSGISPEGNKTKVNMKNVDAGIYFILVNTGNGILKEKIIIR